jgi:hypothetical protein
MRTRVCVYSCVHVTTLETLPVSTANENLLEMEAGLNVCVGYLLLHNKLPQNLELKTKNIISQFPRVRSLRVT